MTDKLDQGITLYVLPHAQMYHLPVNVSVLLNELSKKQTTTLIHSHYGNEMLR